MKVKHQRLKMTGYQVGQVIYDNDTEYLVIKAKSNDQSGFALVDLRRNCMDGFYPTLKDLYEAYGEPDEDRSVKAELVIKEWR